MLSYVKQITSPGSMHETVCSGLVHWDDPEGGRWEGGSVWGAHVYPADSCEYMTKNITIL